MHGGTGARKIGVDRTSASGQVVGYRKLSSRGIIEATLMTDRKRKKKKRSRSQIAPIADEKESRTSQRKCFKSLK